VRTPRQASSRRPDRRTLAAVALVLVVLALAGLAARGPAVVTGEGMRLPTPEEPVRPPEPQPPSTDAEPGTTPPSEPDQDLPRSPFLGYVVLGFLALVGVTAAGLLGRTLWEQRPALRRRRPPAAPPGAEPAAVSLARAAREALTAVEQPAAREAVVRSWLLLGAAASAAGLPARDSETAAEYAARLTAHLGLPGAELDRLAELYREARFSDHEVGEHQRGEARRLLTELSGRLERVGA
jgi:Domain of unknown function (DUF4129)